MFFLMQNIFILPAMQHGFCAKPPFIDQGVMINRSHRSHLRLLLSTEHEVTRFTLEVTAIFHHVMLVIGLNDENADLTPLLPNEEKKMYCSRYGLMIEMRCKVARMLRH